MKISYFFIVIFSFLTISCAVESESSEQTNWLEISKKLNSFDPSVIDKTGNDSGAQLSKKTYQNKSFSKAMDNGCDYSTTRIIDSDDIITTITTSYFDKGMNPITDCDIFSDLYSSEYNSTESQITVGPGFTYDLTSVGNHKRPTNSSPFTYIDNLLILGELDFDGSIFNIIEGSYIRMDLSIDPSNLDIDNFDIMLEINYRFEFEVNSMSYHFDMNPNGEVLLDESLSEDLELTMEYPFYNSRNTQIGIIKYVQNLKTQKESFILYDLNGNLVE